MTREAKPLDLNYPDFFVAGLTGSGKDTIVNYLKEYFGYRKMRIAKTIKTIIMEKNDVTFDELEELKRDNPEWREKHHEESAYLTKESSLIRTKQIAKRTAMDFESVTNIDKQIAVCDVRCADEAGILLDNDFIGIFLSRTTAEYKNTEHFTEQNMFVNGQLISLIREFPTNTFVIVLNATNEHDIRFIVELEKLLNDGFNNFKLVTFDSAPTGDMLLEKIDDIVSDLIDKENE